MLSEREYQDLVDDTLSHIETVFDSLELDVDMENNGTLTLVFPSGRQWVFSRQAALQQLWLATAAGGFHFDYRNQQWRSTDDESLSQVLQTLGMQETGQRLPF